MNINSNYIQVKTAQEIINEMKDVKQDNSNTKFGNIKFFTKSFHFMSKFAFFQGNKVLIK